MHGDDGFTVALLPHLIKNYEAWEQRHFVAEVGLFWQTGHDDGMEYNINSRQTKDILRGAPSFRPSFNTYMWADAQAIARMAERTGDVETAKRFRAKADALKERIQALLWDPKREFFFPMYRDAEERDGHKIKARTLTYESGQFAEDPHGRELIGFVPWQFNMLDENKGYEVAWKKIMDRDAFYADFGPSTVERHDPLFLLKNSCCWWSGQSWPYATTQTLKGMANLLQGGERTVVTADDYVKLLQVYARTHRKQGRPYLAEACHPDTGSFEGHDGYNHSEHYFHSGYCDLVITGLVGLKPVSPMAFDVQPLAPATWDWFALDDVSYHGRRVSIVWDRRGTRYAQGAGMHVLVDGQKVASAPNLERLSVSLPPQARPKADPTHETAVNFAVNNDGTYYPRLTASYSAPKTSTGKLHDGNYWYHQHPPNRWTCEGSPNERDWVIVDLGTPRRVHTVKLYVLDDGGESGSLVRTPERMQLDAWIEAAWRPIAPTDRHLQEPLGHRANVVRFDPIETNKFRVTLQHRAGTKSGLTEIEAWGDAKLPLAQAPPPEGNLALNSDPKTKEFPKVSASHTSRFDRLTTANDGITNFLPTPANRWTSYESKSPSDWLEIDFGRDVEFRRIELALYDDRGGVQAPSAYVVQQWTGTEWRDVPDARKSPERPVGGQWNEVRFDPVTATRVRIVFTHRGAARSGVTEVMVWND
ncbi:MGH1-like glycoside hydrolase domain-containing protein [Anatilimnocola aggregata]|uniref:MGH1-like glycoside hydrolase domain-containing protein n=1 Tax=Anatilimnocola aggregata TaxID=2528021 RepID=UPI00192E44FF|nr:discoidin domain-containing protein [Anatilimnocola aggregata]